MRLDYVVTPDGVAAVRKQAETDEEIDALAREAARLAEARRPGVVALLHHAPGVLDLALGGSTTVETWRPASWATAVAFVAATADLLAGLHRDGVVHGRLDPSHILVAADGQPVLCGWAGRSGRAPHPPVDVFALGCLLDLLLDRCPPMRAPGREALRRAADAAKAHDPADRPTAAALAGQLRGLARSAAPSPRHIGPRRPLAGIAWTRRPAAAGGALVALVAAIAVLATAARVDHDPVGATETVADGGPGTEGPGPGPAGADGGDLRPAKGSLPDAATAAPPCASALVPLDPPFPAPPCTASIPVPGGLTVGDRRFEIGDPGDEILVADVRCDGHPIVALIRPTVGLAVLFPDWATPGTDAVGQPLPRVPVGSRLETGTADDHGCARLYATAPDGATVRLT